MEKYWNSMEIPNPAEKGWDTILFMINHYDDKSFLDSIKVEELEKFRKLLSEKRNKKYKQKIENYDYRQLRQLKQQQLNYNWFDAKK